MNAALEEGFVYESVAEPACLIVVWFGQVHCLAHKGLQSVGLWQCLSVELSYPLLRTVG